MSILFFGFALADSMFDDGAITRRTIDMGDDSEELESLLLDAADTGNLVSCCNPSHVATINAMRQRFGLFVEIPETPPRVKLADGDQILVMGVRGLPRLTDRHEYSQEEIASADFSFTIYTFYSLCGSA